MAVLLACLLLSSACSTGNQQNSNDPGQTSGPSDDPGSKGVVIIDPSDLFSGRDLEVGYDETTSAAIKLNGNTAASGSNAVKVSGSTVAITDEGTYILSGTLNDGMIIVDADKADKVRLVLNNVKINSKTSAPIYIRQADKVFITLAPDSANTLSNGGTFAQTDENSIDAVIFSKDDLTLNGSGTLIINSPAGHGIVSKDELKLTGGTYEIKAASHGLEGKDNVCIGNAKLSITSGMDGIHAENPDDSTLGFIYIQSGTFNITSEGDGIAASAKMQIDGGTFHIVSGGGSANAAKSNASSKGIKASGELVINDGSFTVDSADDAVHSNASITITGGTIEIATGDDGFHADDTLTILSGTVKVTESYEGLEGLHVKVSGGDLTLYAGDDGINAAGGTDQSGFGGRDRFGGRGDGAGSKGSIEISGGKLYINARGDGIDANGTLTISGGYTVVCGPIKGDTATLDYDVSGVITGGTFIGTGASRRAMSFSDSEQGVISVRIASQPAGTAITLSDSKGNKIISDYKPELEFEIVILSSPDIVKGETYTLNVGSKSDEVTAK